ncbi:MAG: efflux RND transporter periplasmic adaptor subunit [Desulfobacteraceae bacterium]|nr:MAG: efflux RND transporter periplasmic adaptor subunit [Desulfobacteraceae bacterium]
MTKHSKMRILLVTVGLAAALGAGYWLGAGRQEHGAEATTSPAAPAQGERKIKYWKSSMDPTYVRNAPGKDTMGMDLVPVYEGEAGEAAGIAIDPVTIQNMGVRTAPVTRRDLRRSIRAVGLVTYEEQSRFSINSKIEGWIERLYVNQAGQFVKKGQALMEIYSPELVAAQQEYLLALDSSKRLADSAFPAAVDGAQRMLEAARTRLSYWDISDAQIRELEQTRRVLKRMTLYSSFSGVVTMKQAYEGMRVMGGEELFQISDISKVWIHADLYEYELPWVKPGQPALVEFPFAPGKRLSGKITYIYPYVQNETRTVQARIELANPGFELKPDMYANVLIEGRPVAGVLAVPGNAVLNSGKGQTIFVALGEGRFEPRAVETGVSGEEGYVQVLSGLKEGETVVTSAQFMLDSESKLREAIQKMMETQAAPPVEEGHEGHTAPTPAPTPPTGHEGHAAPQNNEDLFK